jgi:hypothetical protein
MAGSRKERWQRASVTRPALASRRGRVPRQPLVFHIECGIIGGVRAIRAGGRLVKACSVRPGRLAARIRQHARCSVRTIAGASPSARPSRAHCGPSGPIRGFAIGSAGAVKGSAGSAPGPGPQTARTARHLLFAGRPAGAIPPLPRPAPGFWLIRVPGAFQGCPRGHVILRYSQLRTLTCRAAGRIACAAGALLALARRGSPANRSQRVQPLDGHTGIPACDAEETDWKAE